MLLFRQYAETPASRGKVKKRLSLQDRGNPTVAGFVLVGGRSSRMGTDKARLAWNSRLLVLDVAAKVEAIAGRVTLIGEPQRYQDLNMNCLSDSRPGLGPLAGIETALASRQGTLNLIAACDMPGLQTAWFLELFREACESNAQCVAARDTTGKVHPLCAVYHSSCLPHVRRALDSGELKLAELLRRLETTIVDIHERIWNINTPDEWESWTRRGFHSG